MTHTENPFTRKVQVSRYLSLSSFAGLLLLFAIYNLTAPQGSLKLWLIQSLPLAIFIPGLLQPQSRYRSWRTYSWLCFVVLLYFTHAVTNVMSPLASWSDTVQLLLSITLFIGAMLTSRWLQHWQAFSNQQT